MKLLDGEVGVEFGGVEVFVAEEFLDGAEVGSVVHHEGGDGVAEEMAGAFLFDACGLNVFANEVARVAVHSEGVRWVPMASSTRLVPHTG